MFPSKRAAKLVINTYITKFFRENLSFSYLYCLEDE